jgi:hypothetical protein
MRSRVHLIHPKGETFLPTKGEITPIDKKQARGETSTRLFIALAFLHLV